MIIRAILIIWGFVITAIVSAVFVFGDDLLLSYQSTVSAEPGTASSKWNSASVFTVAKEDRELSVMIRDLGIKASMDKLIAESDGGSVRDCHQEAHAIGRLGYKVFGEQSFAQCDASCHSGCYHGAMESFLNEKGTVDLATNINHVCGLFDTRFGNFECLHGVGHGVLAYVDYDMPEAIRQCRELEDWFGTVSCYGGMFMENVLTGQGLGASVKADHTTSWVNRTDPQFPCNKIDQDHDVQYQCYQMQTSWMLTMYNYDFDRVAKECLNAPANMISVCFKSFGRDASGNSLRNVAKIIETCGKVPDAGDYYAERESQMNGDSFGPSDGGEKVDPNLYRNQCIVGAVNVIIDFWGPALKGQASELCGSLTDKPQKDVCYQTLASRIPELVSDVDLRAKICYTFETNYKNLCQNI